MAKETTVECYVGGTISLIVKEGEDISDVWYRLQKLLANDEAVKDVELDCGELQ